ncbi:ATP-binding protein [Paraburkholderia caballeronis]|uniref:Anti-sigma regulatory factor (Ser/Thr protein kinase) n=1 Tax=Paraburkholderia caballeronis TaxID=416943 RepID=A0A1H7STP4_9BURK|nr:ATP-binding protein [Paraburkholderia caballeronis]PXW25644.1 anti-sigma regulatory factor (Ser/Thr protein kinase) [Paraburkholderia caballeronis]PXX01251.1 anti-sigma regulatory factor (Ser/Thr protein kinase) [Paraburkholderia caballeronis]RAJ99396.1 anti-sigma regulatory factor (Ser/Thr protein kinase) [Paraburkholderia caballeronis]SEE29012.1 Anti-sigma regulatory factor (Ser/Thr protein kinase) [Paraburkholderia caballeronis]SEL75931.1 Anti-sigma regulatory factor (Ser/Thr protein kin
MESVLSRAPGAGGGLHRPFEIADASAVAVARRGVAAAARSAGLGETDAGRLALVLTEASTNIVKHARHGEVLVRAFDGGVELIALDGGPGIRDVALALADGHSTAGTPGNGLGAIRRLSDRFALYSQPGLGTVLRALVLDAARAAAPGGPPAAPEIGGVCVPYPGEDVSGDAWDYEPDPPGLTLAIADGLGHGADAHAAAAALLDVLRRGPHRSLTTLMDDAHAALHPTRGAAAALARFDLARSTVSFCGTGNISAVALRTGAPASAGSPPNRSGTPRDSYQLVSRNGIVGHTMRGTQEFELAWRTDSLLVLHSDGIGTRWDLSHYPGLQQQPAAIIAAVLYRDFSRRRDDATVVVVKARPGVRLSHDDATVAAAR